MRLWASMRTSRPRRPFATNRFYVQAEFTSPRSGEARIKSSTFGVPAPLGAGEAGRGFKSAEPGLNSPPHVVGRRALDQNLRGPRAARRGRGREGIRAG